MPRRQKGVTYGIPMWGTDSAVPPGVSNFNEDGTKKNLKADMLQALAQLDFQGNSGKIAGSNTFAEAPNPWLSIEGFGVLGSPFSERESKSITASFNEAPSAQYMRVSNTWKISPRVISFQNPEWNRYLNDVILKFVMNELGVGQSSTSPRLELDHLLICEVGSNFVSDQGTDANKPDGTYGTIVIFLPSTYTGGAICVQQGNQSKVLDVPSKTFFTGVSFWFTDAPHKVEPVQSGCRLALTYHLVHISAVEPVPAPPTSHQALDRICDVLHRWEQGYYTTYSGYEILTHDILASLLQSQSRYRSSGKGLQGLRGSDARILGNLRSVAEDLGYGIYIGDLKCQFIDYIDHVYSDEEDPDDGNLSDGPNYEHACFMTVTNLVDLNGTRLSGLSRQGLEIDQADVLQGDFFRDTKPDDRELKRGYNSGEDRITYTYTRQVFVIFHRKFARELMLESGGFAYAISELKKVVPSLLTPDDLSFADATLSALGDGYDLPARISQMLEIAATWTNVELWNKTCKKAKNPSDLKENDLLAALRVFDFDAIRLMIEEKINDTTIFGKRLAFIDTVSAQPRAAGSMTEWRTEQHLKALASVENINQEGMPYVIPLAKLYGITKTMEYLLPVFRRESCYQECYPALIRGLYETAMSRAEHSEDWKRYANLCLGITANLWAKTYSRSHMDERKLRTALGLIDLCLSVGQATACRPILSVIVPKKSFHDIREEFQLFLPWLPQLSDVLSRHSHSFTSPLFDDFARHMAGIYSRDVACAPKPKDMKAQVSLQKVGCGCGLCEALDAFLTSSLKNIDLRMPMASFDHLNEPLRRASPVIGTSLNPRSDGTFRILKLEKNGNALATCRETNRVSDTKAFFELLGGMDVVSKLMGDRFVDVQRTLHERKPFKWADDYLTQTWPPSDSASPPRKKLKLKTFEEIILGL